MKKFIVGFIALFALLVQVEAQKCFSKDALVSFNATSANSPEKIEAKTPKGIIVVDETSGAVEMSILIKGFHFESALMEEHFNENYMESDKYKDAKFKGAIGNFATVNLKKDGTYKVAVSGKLTIHGVTKDVNTHATLVVSGGAVTESKCSFSVALADYGIQIPSLVKDKVASEAKIDIAAGMKPLGK